jgi:hypothetical protein
VVKTRHETSSVAVEGILRIGRVMRVSVPVEGAISMAKKKKKAAKKVAKKKKKGHG